ncbi:MAG: hypothetical protein WBL45_01075 [Solirubrobacterales bacterium]
MSVLAIIGVLAAVILALAVAVFRALAIDEVRGRIQRRVEESVEATLASLPEEQQAEWGDEWRAEVAAMKSTPFTAIAFARGLRHTAGQLAGDPALAPAGATPARSGAWGLRLPAVGDRLRRVAQALFVAFISIAPAIVLLVRYVWDWLPISGTLMTIATLGMILLAVFIQGRASR